MNAPVAQHQPKVAVVYYSGTGNVKTIADSIVAGAADAGAETRLLRVVETAPQAAIDSNEAWKAHTAATAEVPVVTHDDLRWADAVVFGTPTRYGNISSQLAGFIDTLGGMWSNGELVDKVYSGFTSTATAHGGRETTLQALYTSVQHWGGILVTPGYTDPIQFTTGTPYGPSNASGGGDPVSDDVKAGAELTGRRVATVTAQLLAGRAALVA